MVFVAGHFGEWLQGRLGPGGPLALITLACPEFGVRVTRRDGPFEVTGAGPLLDATRAGALLTRLGLLLDGRFRVAADFPPGGGAGMSTAALVALARAAGATQGLEAACLATEGASDPLMLSEPGAALWAPRAGQVLRSLPPPPRCEVLGGFFGPPLRTDPADLAFPDIADLVEAWRPEAGPETCARLASLSAERCTALRGPSGDPMAALARETGAPGHARAHTGSARALLFAPGQVPDGAPEAMRAAGLTGICRFMTGGGA